MDFCIRFDQNGLVCPLCGNNGEVGGEWEKNGEEPFRLVEEVVRSFSFSAVPCENGVLSIVGNASDDSVDWESGRNLRFECVQCFGEFPLPETARLDFS
jgi:hypothetical protein